MPSPPADNSGQHFAEVTDPRNVHNVRHSRLNIMTIAICGVIGGADNWVDIEMFGNAKRSWFETFLDLPHGIPSHDTFGRVFRHIDPEEFQASFQRWTQSIHERKAGEVLAVDGKTLRRSKDSTLGKGAIEMVSVWASQNQLVLAQDKIEDRTNEITAIPEVLRLLDLAGYVVTLDAIGCQTEMAETIIDQGGDYVLAVKDNQETLRQDVEAAFEHTRLFNRPHHHKTVNKGHGRIEVRECWAISDPDILRHIALNLLKQDTSLKVGVKAKRLRAGGDEQYLLKVLQHA